MNQEDKKAIIGSAALLALYAAVAVTCSILPDSGGAKKEEERTTIRQDASAMWHRAKCAVRFCDEDWRCPVWSPKYSKCYMLDKEGEAILKKSEKELDKETFERYFVK